MLCRPQRPLGPRPVSYPRKVFNACSKPAGRLLAVKVQAFRGPEEQAAKLGTTSFLRVPTLPLSYYEALRVPSTASVAEIQAACEHLVGLPTKAAYSAETLFSRAVLLTSARERLSDPVNRQGIDRKLASGDRSIRVTQADLPGALVLLQETGNYQSTIDMATSWLDHFSNDPAVPDVAICLAEALCDRAAFAFDAWEKQLPTVDKPLLSACEDLSRAMDVCRRYDVAPALLNDIATALKDYADKYALELLSLPLDAQHAARRQHGLDMLVDRLKQPLPSSPEEAIAHVAKIDDMVHEARYVLTAAEQLRLIPVFRACPALQQGEAAAYVVWHAAFALVAAGYTQHLPHYVYRARQLFGEAQRRFQAVAEEVASGGGGEADVPRGFMEQSCCDILLGDLRGAHTTLGLTPGSWGEAEGSCKEPEAAAFIQSRSAGDDLTPGMTDMAHIWVRGAVLGFYRDFKDSDLVVQPDSTPAPGSSGAEAGGALAAWYSQPTVWWYNKVYALLRFTPLLLIIHLCTRASRGIAAWLHAITTTTPATAAIETETAEQPLVTDIVAGGSYSAAAAYSSGGGSVPQQQPTQPSRGRSQPRHSSPMPTTSYTGSRRSSINRSLSPFVPPQYATSYTGVVQAPTPTPSPTWSPPPVTSRLAFSPGIPTANRDSPVIGGGDSHVFTSGGGAPAATAYDSEYDQMSSSNTSRRQQQHMSNAANSSNGDVSSSSRGRGRGRSPASVLGVEVGSSSDGVKGSTRMARAGGGVSAVGSDDEAHQLLAIPDAVDYFARTAKGNGIQKALAHVLCLMPFRRAVPLNEDLIATAGIDPSEYELRRQLAQMERAAWDPPRSDTGSPGGRLVPHLVSLLLLAGALLAVTALINPEALWWALSLPAVKAIMPPGLLPPHGGPAHVGGPAAMA